VELCYILICFLSKKNECIVWLFSSFSVVSSRRDKSRRISTISVPIRGFLNSVRYAAKIQTLLITRNGRRDRGIVRVFPCVVPLFIPSLAALYCHVINRDRHRLRFNVALGSVGTDYFAKVGQNSARKRSARGKIIIAALSSRLTRNFATACIIRSEFLFR